jgi:cobalt-zinc-cadmium efflux system membrane fusion protein
MPLKKDVITGVVTVAAAITGWFGWQHFQQDNSKPEMTTSEPAAEEPAVDAMSVTLPSQKLEVIGVSLSEVTTSVLRPESHVPGRLQYDDRRHVEIRSASPGIIMDIKVRPGEAVQAGDVLVELNSPEVGNARADVLQRQAELRLATENRDWQKSTCEGLQKLSDAIRKRVSVDDIRVQFRDTILGKSRDQLLTAYSDMLLAESLVASAEQNAKSGVIPGRTVEVRVNNRDNAEAALMAALEEQTFTALQSCRQAEAQAEDADRRHRVSLQTVRTLLGKSLAASGELNVVEKADADADLQPELLSVVRLRAPFAGTIERRQFAASERVDAGDAILTLADTTTLWVAADLREREWNALTLKPGDELQVFTSGSGHASRKASVYFVGREVDPATNAVPLVAVIDNSDGRLRPGMFVRVAVPVAEGHESLAIPESSLLEHDQKSFVFTPDGESTFRRVDITPGIHTAGMVEVLSGLSQGEKVVAHGGFYLKSELLLQGESE